MRENLTAGLTGGNGNEAMTARATGCGRLRENSGMSAGLKIL